MCHIDEWPISSSSVLARTSGTEGLAFSMEGQLLRKPTSMPSLKGVSGGLTMPQTALQTCHTSAEIPGRSLNKAWTQAVIRCPEPGTPVHAPRPALHMA